jgi:outer membrane protein assembly factor BamD
MKIFLLALVLVIAGCNSDKKVVADNAITPNKSAQILYDEAGKLLDKKKYSSAAKKFEKIDELYPFSDLAVKSQVKAGYSRYKDGNYEDAIKTFDKVIFGNPGYEQIDFVHFLRGACFYEQITDVERDNLYAREAKSSFEVLVSKFPDSKYATESKDNLKVILDNMAGKEMEIGRFYLKSGNTAGAINRFKVVIDSYQTTKHVVEALYRLTESYTMLGLKDEAKKYAAVLGKNYPTTQWYKKAFELAK